mgnify:FL=1|nr:MAG TPA: hypothetical protein [Caudoviricetes sp.]
MMAPWVQCKGLLAQYMYRDRVTVTRQEIAVDEEGADIFTTKDVYKDIPCKLSQYGKSLQSEQDARAFVMRNDLRVNMDPAIIILPNDILTVTHEGQTLQLNAAQPFYYPDHVEVIVRRTEEA